MYAIVSIAGQQFKVEETRKFMSTIKMEMKGIA